ncbi:MAG: acetyl-CoA carboxylase biotin carboxyl carrier protein [Planctomycetes bacterium]|nr:acetyl-CoA carboxylase biotin carboxyl carrier protein [Planctomycetota bacterium]
MDIKQLQRLVALMQRGEITELEVDDNKNGLRVRLKRGTEQPASNAPVVHVTQGAAAPVALPLAAAIAPLAEAAAPAAAKEPAGKPFPSPMVGTYYRAPSPEAEPFVRVGTRVDPETVVCIIEAMKVMNEIRAETSGEIVELLVENGEPVEFGQPLFLIKPD